MITKIPSACTCRHHAFHRSRSKRSILFGVAVWVPVVRKVQIRIFIFHCRRQSSSNQTSLGLCDQRTCGELSHRSSTSDLSPPVSVFAASPSSCFRPPAMKWTNQPNHECQLLFLKMASIFTYLTSNRSCSSLWYDSSWDSKQQRILNFFT